MKRSSTALCKLAIAAMTILAAAHFTSLLATARQPRVQEAPGTRSTNSLTAFSSGMDLRAGLSPDLGKQLQQGAQRNVSRPLAQ